MRKETAAPVSAVAQKARHIAWLIQGSESYGVRRTTLCLSRALMNAGWRVTFLAFAPGPFVDDLCDRGCSVVQLRLGRVPAFGGTLLRSSWSIVKVAKYQRRARQHLMDALLALQPDAVHVRAANLMFAAARGVRRLGLPLLWQMPGVLSSSYPLGLNRRFYQWYVRRYGVTVVANSQHTASSLDTSNRGRPRVLYLGVDPAQFDPDSPVKLRRDELGIPTNAPVFGIVGRISPQKGQDVFLRAMLDVLATSDAHLLLVGGPQDSEFAEDVRGIIRTAGIESKVHLVGPAADPAPYYQVMDVAVSSSTVPESFGLSVIEAMMLGKPVLAHALGGPKETVIDGETGWHVREATIDSFAEGVQRALAERTQWAKLGANARCRALECFSDTRMAEHYRTIVESTLEAFPGRKSQRRPTRISRVQAPLGAREQ